MKIDRRAFLVLFFINFMFSPPAANAATETVRIYGGTGDGQVITAPYVSPWNVQYYNTVGRNPDYTSETVSVLSGSFYTPTKYLGIIRGFLVFDTSALPDDATIRDVKVGLHILETRDDYNDQFGYVSVLEGKQADTFSISSTDIALCGNVIEDPEKGSGDINITDIEVDSYQEIVLNEIGLGWVNKGGYSKFCIREGHDIENVETVKNYNDGTWDESAIVFASADAVSANTRPYLEITYDAVENEPENKYPLYTQTVSPYPSVAATSEWAEDVYADGLALCGKDIAACGCAITSLVMAGRHAGITEDVLENDVDPGNLNDYLKETKGYFSGGAVKWLAAQAYLGTFAGETITSRFSAPQYVYTMADIDAALTAGNKAVLGYNGSHFIWLTDKTADGYLLNDPVWYNTKTANDVVNEASVLVKDYNDTFVSARVFTIYDEPVALAEYGIEAQITGTAELLYRSVAGERVGHVDGAVVVDLDHASYGDAENISLTGDLGNGGKHLLVPDAGGTFTLEVIGTGFGEYQLEFYALGADGEVTTFDLSGRTIPGVTTTFTFDLTTGEVTEESISYEQFLDILDREMAGYSAQQRAFFMRWAEKIYTNMAEKTVSQTLQSIEVYQKLLLAKKVDSPVLSSVLELLEEGVKKG